MKHGLLHHKPSAAYEMARPGERILDFGSGDCRSLLYYDSIGAVGVGLEIDPNAKTIADYHNLDLRIGSFDSRLFERNSFDLVVMDQVVEHLEDPEATFTELLALMRQGARLAITTPNSRSLGRKLFGRRWIHWHAPYHLNLFSRQSMDRLAQNAGYSIVRITYATPAAWIGYQLTVLPWRLFGRKALWFWAKHLGNRPNTTQRIWSGIIAAFVRIGLAGSIARILDLFAEGDNLQIVLRKVDGQF